MKARLHFGVIGGSSSTRTHDNFQRLEVITDDGKLLLFQVLPTMDDGVPGLRIRAVEGVHVGDVYHGNALDVQPEVSNVINCRLRRQP